MFVLIFAVAVFGTIFIDHDLLSRDADGWPVLYRTPSLRHAVDAFHFIVMFVVPSALAVWFLSIGASRRVGIAWVIAGGILVCVFAAIALRPFR